MENTKRWERSANARVMKVGMWACCVAMLVPVVGFVVANGSIGGFPSNLGTFAPLALCLGMHFAMHRFIGKSCDGSDDNGGARQKETRADTPGSRAGAME